MLRSLVRTSEGVVEDIPQTVRIERVLASARLFLAVSSLIAIYVDPTQPSRYATLADILLSAYLAHSFGVFVLVVLRRYQKLTPRFVLGVHVVDLCWPALLSFFTEGAESPFYLFFFFALLAAAYRWGFWETLGTTLFAIFLLAIEPLIVSAGPSDKGHLLQGEFELNRFIMRVTYLLLIGLLMGYLGEEGKRLRAESSVIARVLAKVQAEHGLTATMRVVLQELLELFGAGRAVLAVQDTRGGGAFKWEAGTLPQSGTEAQVSQIDPTQKQTWFFQTGCPSLHATRRRLEPGNPFRIVALDSKGRRVRGAACSFPADFCSLPDTRSVLMVSVAFEQEWLGRLFLFKPQVGVFRERELRFFQAVVQAASPAVYNAYLSGRLRSRAGALERTRVARELHDGVLQVLSSLALQLEAVRRTSHAPPRMIEEVTRIQHLLHQESVNLRDLMQRVTPLDVAPGNMVDFLRNTVNKFRIETGIVTSFTSQVDGSLPPRRVCRELVRVLQEALVNVRKHSGAQSVSVDLMSKDGTLRLVVRDDGKGFDFSGRLSQAELDALRKGPAVIKDRVRSIGGDLAIESAPDRGARLEVTIPLAQKAMAAGARLRTSG